MLSATDELSATGLLPAKEVMALATAGYLSLAMIGDPGSARVVLSRDLLDLQQTGPGGSCSIEMYLERRTVGSPDPRFRSGGTFLVSQVSPAVTVIRIKLTIPLM